ncbi:hypothetical protein [Rhodococcus sp. HNM0569]|nr:hypothetical protein [Rhodococcus sp. HNM0569]
MEQNPEFSSSQVDEPVSSDAEHDDSVRTPPVYTGLFSDNT